MTLRLGRFALVVMLYPSSAWGVYRWTWKGETSWRHGSARFGRLKLVW